MQGCSLDKERAKAALGGAPAARSCSIVVEYAGQRLLLRGAPAAGGWSIEGERRLPLRVELPLRRAARW